MIGIDLLFNLSNVLIAVPMYIDEVRFLENSYLEKLSFCERVYIYWNCFEYKLLVSGYQNWLR